MANTSSTLQILVEIQATLNDLTKAIGGTDSLGASADATNASLGGIAKQLDTIGSHTSGLSEVKSQLNEMTEAGGGFLSMLEGGFGGEFAHRAVDAVGGIAEAFKRALESGVDYNAKMETSALGLAATLRSAMPDKFPTLDAARVEATRDMDAIREKANKLGVDFHGLVEIYSASLPILVKGGVTSVEQQLTLVSTLMSAAAAKGVTGMQAFRDILDGLSGRAEQINLFKELQLSNETLKQGIETGQLYGTVMGRLPGYLEAASVTANTFAGRLQTAKNEWEQLEGVAAQPIFEAARDALGDIDKALDGLEAHATANAIGIEIATWINIAKTFAGWLDEIPHKFEGIRAAAQAVDPILGAAVDWAGGVYDQGKLAALEQQNTKIAQSIRDQVEDAKSAFQVEQARIALANAIAAAHQKIAESQGVEKAAAESLLDALTFTKNDFEIIVGQGHEAANAAEGITSAFRGANAELSGMMAKLPAIIGEMRQVANAADFARKLANEATAAGKANLYSGRQTDNLQYLNEQLKKVGYAGPSVSNAGDAASVVEAIKNSQGEHPATSGMLGLVPSNNAITDPKAFENIQAVQVKIAETQKQIDTLTRQQTEDTRQQAEELSKSKADYEYRLQHAQLIAHGEQGAADQLERQHNIWKMAGELAIKAHTETKDQLDAATRLYDAEVAAGDATKAATAAKKQGAAAGREAANAAKEEAMYSRQVAEEKLHSIQAQGQQIESNPFLFEDDKAKLLMSNYAAQRQQIQAIIQLDTQRIALERNSTNPGIAAQLRADTKGLSEAGIQLAKVNQQMQHMSFAGAIRGQLTAWVNQFGTAAHQVGQVLTTTLGHAVDGLSNAISGLVLHTMTWKQAFAQAASSIVQDIIRIAVQYVVSQLVMEAISLATGQSTASSSSGMAQSAAAEWETPAILASISSYGLAAGVGVAAVEAAVAVGQGVAAAGYAAGGYTGDGGIAEVAGAVHRREYVFDAATVHRAGGPAALDHLRRQIHAPSTTAATAGVGPGGAGGAGGGGASSGGRRGGQAINIHNVTVRSDAELRAYMHSAEGQRQHVLISRKNRSKIGIRV